MNERPDYRPEGIDRELAGHIPLPIGVTPEQHEADLALLERVKAELGMCQS